MIQSVAFIIHVAVVIFWVAVIIQVTVIYGQYGVSSYKIWRVTVSITFILIQKPVSIVTLEAIMIHVLVIIILSTAIIMSIWAIDFALR